MVRVWATFGLAGVRLGIFLGGILDPSKAQTVRFTSTLVGRSYPFTPRSAVFGNIFNSLRTFQPKSATQIAKFKCGTFSSFRLLSPDIYHINILRNPNEVDVNWGRSAKPKYTYF